MTEEIKQERLNYGEAFDSLSVRENRNWFNPKKTGRYKIYLLEDFSLPYVVKFDKEEQKKVAAKIKIGENIFSWSVTVAKTEASLYGQLMFLGKHWGSLKDKTIDLLVKEVVDKNNQSKREFTIDQYIDLKGVA